MTSTTVATRARSITNHRWVRKVVAPALMLYLLYLLLEQIWPAPAGVIVEGIIIGSLTALMAFGIALIYRANRVINFAQADMGLLPAVVLVSLMTAWNWSYWLATPAALILGVGLAWLIDRIWISRFSKAPRLILMVVTIGISQVLAGFSFGVPALFGQLIPPSQFPVPFQFSYEINPIIFHANDLLAVIVVPLIIFGLFAFLRHTSIGIAIRASAQSADRAALLGVNVGFTESVAWMVAGLLATVSMILRAGILGLPVGAAGGAAILVRVLAAAVIGRMENFTIMFVAACGIGVVETSILWNTGSASVLDPVLFVIIVVALLLQRRDRESRVDDQATSSWTDAANVRQVPSVLADLPEVRWVLKGLLALAAAVVLLLPLVLGPANTNLAAAVGIYSIVALSLVILVGWGGEISLGQVGFVAVGAMAAASLNVHLGWDLIPSVLVAGMAGVVASLFIGLPALRIRGMFFAVTTLAFAVMTSSYLLDRDQHFLGISFSYLPDDVLQRVERFPLLGFIDISSEKSFYYVCAFALFLVLWMMWGMQKQRTARVLIATRENERTAQAFGIPLTRTRLTTFALASFIAASAGGLLSWHQQALGEQIFAPAESIRVLTMVVVGGLGSIPGAILGAVYLQSTVWFNTIVPAQYSSFFTLAGSGLGLIVILQLLPGGLGQLLYSARDFYLRQVAERRGIIVPSLVADVAEAGPLEGEPGHVPAKKTHEVKAPALKTSKRAPTLARRLARKGAPELDYFSFPDIRGGGGVPNLLSLRAVDVAYGSVQVLFGVNLEVTAGEVIALLGTNGAGKSTVLRGVSGLVGPKNGTISIEGVDITGIPAHKIARRGIIQVPGGRGVFPALTVAENLRVAAWMYRRDAEYVKQATAEALALFPALQDRLNDPAANLSGGTQQMLTLAMAFIAKPKILMIDELSLGLAPLVVEKLLEVVREFQRQGMTLILVEQSVNVALTLAETAYFMEKGEVRFHGPTAELLERPDVLRSVFLEGAATRDRVADQGATPVVAAEPTTAAPPVAWEDRPVVLSATDVTKSFRGITAINGVTFELHEREILGVIGPNGAGKTTLFDLISGFLLPDEGRIEFLGRDITDVRPDIRSRRGLARSFQDARLFNALTVHQTIMVALDRDLRVKSSVAGALHLPNVTRAERAVAERADELVEMMGLDSFRDKFVSELSTGSRRIVDLACQIALDPKVILFDEPSSGIAQRETEALGPLLLRIRELTGASLLVIEHDMPLITSVSDRIIALDLGQVVTSGDAQSVLNHPHVVASYLGSTREVIERSGVVSEANVR